MRSSREPENTQRRNVADGQVHAVAGRRGRRQAKREPRVLRLDPGTLHGGGQKLSNAGQLAATYKLHDQVGARLTVRGGQVVDGPFVETKDAVGGAFVIEASSLDEAT